MEMFIDDSWIRPKNKRVCRYAHSSAAYGVKREHRLHQAAGRGAQAMMIRFSYDANRRKRDERRYECISTDETSKIIIN
jgi:hypothetical protein